MDIKSLYTVIPNNDGLQALKYHLNLRPLQQPPTDTLSFNGLNLFSTSNSFEFDNEHYQQVGGIAMGTEMSPNYACLFVGHVARKMLEDYQGNKPQLYKHYIKDVLGASSGTRQDLENFIEFCSAYHPFLKYTFEISESSLSFLDLCLSISNTGITTTTSPPISTATLTTAHPILLTVRKPFHTVSFSVFEGSAQTMMTMWLNPRKWHRSLRTDILVVLLPRRQKRTQKISRRRALGNFERGDRARCTEKVPLVLTYQPKKQEVKKILLKNFCILNDDPTTKEIFNTKPLCVYPRDTSLLDILVPSTLSLYL